MAVIRIVRVHRHLRRPEVARLGLCHHAPRHGRALRRRRLGFIKGGMGSITQALAGYAREHGVEIVTDAAVAELRVDDGRIGAVVLEDGREFRAPSSPRTCRRRPSISTGLRRAACRTRCCAKSGLPDLLDRL